MYIDTAPAATATSSKVSASRQTNVMMNRDTDAIL